MGGKILEYEAKTIMNEGRAEGEEARKRFYREFGMIDE